MSFSKKTALTSGAVLIIVLFLILPVVAGASNTYSQTAQEAQTYLLNAAEVYRNGEPEEAKKLIDKSFFGPFESEGLEKAIETRISEKRVFELEQLFKQLKALINNGAPAAEVENVANKLGNMLEEDGSKLDTKTGSVGATFSTPFFQALIIIIREGFEAILIISAIVTYLIKSGNNEKIRTVYSGAAGALLASIATAIILKLLFSRTESFSEELLEGITMLLAVAVLFWVSFWLTGKVQAQKWQEYIEGKVKSSLSAGNTLALAAAAFFAVYREGAETILFYQALITGNQTATVSIALGFITGCLALIGIFFVFRYGSVRVPIKPFFIVTSIFLYCLAIIFAGQGVMELQEAGVISTTVISGVPVIGALGIYPTWETLLLQIILVAAALGGIVWQTINSRRKTPGSAATSPAHEEG